MRLLSKKNRLLGELPARMVESLLPNLQLIELRKGVPLPQLSHYDDTVYFPISCVFALSSRRAAGCSSFQTFVSASDVFGLTRMARTPGISYDLKLAGTGHVLSGAYKPIWRAIEQAGLNHRITFLGLSEIAQVAVINSECISSHKYTERLARLALEARDAFGDDRDITISQTEWASLLGTRRETISTIFRDWIKRGLMNNLRAKTRVSDSDGLRELSCDCYEAAKEAKATGWQSLSHVAG